MKPIWRDDESVAEQSSRQMQHSPRSPQTWSFNVKHCHHLMRRGAGPVDGPARCSWRRPVQEVFTERTRRGHSSDGGAGPLEVVDRRRCRWENLSFHEELIDAEHRCGGSRCTRSHACEPHRGVLVPRESMPWLIRALRRDFAHCE